MVRSVSLAQFPIVSVHIGDMLEENKLVKCSGKDYGKDSGEGLGGFGAEVKFNRNPEKVREKVW